MSQTKRNHPIPTEALERVAPGVLALHSEVGPTDDAGWDAFAVAVNKRWPRLVLGRGRVRCEALIRRCLYLVDAQQGATRNMVNHILRRFGPKGAVAQQLGLQEHNLTNRLGGHSPFTGPEILLVQQLHDGYFPSPAATQLPIPQPVEPVIPPCTRPTPKPLDDTAKDRAIRVLRKLLMDRSDNAHALILDLALEGSDTALRFLERKAGIPVGD